MKAKTIAVILFALAFFTGPASSFAQQKTPPIVNSKYYGNGKSAIISPISEDPLMADGVNFKPLDFLVGGYGTCMMSMMASEAGKSGFQLSEARTEISYEFDSDKGRIGKIDIKCFVKEDDYTPEQKQILESAAKRCPTGNSLHPDIKKNIEILYGIE